MSYIGEVPRGHAVCNPSYDDGLTPRPSPILTLGSSHLGGGGNATWLEGIIPNTTNVAQFSSLWTRSTNDFNNGGYAVLGGARTSEGTAFPVSVVGVGGFAVCDTSDGPGRAGYFEARRMNVTANTYGIECAMVNFGDVRVIDPYNMFGGAGITPALWLSSGHPDESGAGLATCAIGVYNRGDKFSKGIVFGATALNGNDGVTGIGTAISLPKGDAIVWHQPNTDMPVAQIRSDSFDGDSGGAAMIFNDNQIFFKNYNGLSTGFEIDVRPGLTKHVITFGGGALNAGLSTNAGNLSISSNGGEIHLGGDCTVIGSLTVTDGITGTIAVTTIDAAGSITTDATIHAVGNISTDSSLFVTANASIAGSLFVSTNLSVTGSIYGNTTVHAHGDLSTDANLQVDGNGTVGGSFHAVGNVSCDGQMNCDGDLFTSGSLLAENDIKSNTGAFVGLNYAVQKTSFVSTIPDAWTLYTDVDDKLKAKHGTSGTIVVLTP